MEMQMHRRMIAVFCVITLLMTTVMFRIYYINMSDYLATASSTQGRYIVDVAQGRGTIYDRNMVPLVNERYEYVASILPTPQNIAALLETVTEDGREAFLERMSNPTPFVMPVESDNIYASGVDVFRVPVRYSDAPLAPHVVGYLGSDGVTGVAGIERAYNDHLVESGMRITATYQTDAVGRAMAGGGTDIRRENENNQAGVVLSIDAEIQEIAQDALETGWDKGAVVVMDITTGDILAMASTPGFDSNDIAASLESEDAPFIDRGISGYNIGSVFKLVVSAAALENNISRYHEYYCEGQIDVSGQIFRCNNNAVHGLCDMERALEVSCNAYFIDLAQHIGPEYLVALCENLGLGSSQELADGLYTAAGNLPDMVELSSPAGLANFSFGQGSSLASPMQMAQVVAVIAGGGTSVTPRLVQGTTTNGVTLDDTAPVYASNRIISQYTADTLTEMMISVIEEGSGRTGRPVSGGAGGKTSSAQTGAMTENEDGEEVEIVHAWFAGFFPADTPRYACVVFCEGGESGEQIAAPIFKRVADGINALGR